MTNAQLTIGVFDSGVGGLSVFREIRSQLPEAALIYVADTAYAPYGDRAASEIIERSLRITDFLIEQKVDALVVACNTASVHAVQEIRACCAVPVVAIEPAIKPAALTSKSKVIAVLATSQTIASDSVARMLATYGPAVRILLQPCPGLVEHIENGDISSPALRAKLAAYLTPLLEQGADTVVLGCTHYPFLTTLLSDIAGPLVNFIDPAPAVAKELVRRLARPEAPTKPQLVPPFAFSLDNTNRRTVDSALERRADTFYSSAASAPLNEVISKLLQYRVALHSLAI